MSWRRVKDGYLDHDARIWFFTDYYSWSSGHGLAVSRQGRDVCCRTDRSSGTPLSGGGNYRLRLPPNIPAANFWSLTLYEAENASGYANGQRFCCSVHATSRSRTPTARLTFTSAQRRRPAKRATGCAPFRAKASLRSCDFTPATAAVLDRNLVPGDIEKIN